jgi:post-segregation antitoxin (ccd killing protein)
MYVIRLTNGNLLVPDSAVSEDGQLMSEAYVEIGPDDPDYARLADQALTQEEHDERRRRWQEGDEPLRREFQDFLARRGSAGPPPDPAEGR